jgi:type II secretory pathway component PulF
MPIGAPGEIRTGELSGETAADVRAALRRARLQVLDLRPLRPKHLPALTWIDRHLRARRREVKSDLFDSLSTMLDSGLPLTESLDALIESSRGRPRSMLVQVREGVRSGRELAEAMADHASWFDPVELALVRAGQHAGDLAGVLRTLADRHARSGELSQKLIGALAYPALVACVGIGVVVFLSTKTLPDLVQILDGAGVQTPRLTAIVMSVGQTLASIGIWLLLGAVILIVALLSIAPALARRGYRLPRWTRRCIPLVARRLAVARLSSGLSDLLRAGVPAVESLRVLSPTIGGLGAGDLRAELLRAADRLERGEEFATALDDPLWFDAEFRRLLAVGENAGELEGMLTRIGERYERRSRVLIDRLASLLEPAVILSLAVVIGIVVIAAVLPLLRLQEVL